MNGNVSDGKELSSLDPSSLKLALSSSSTTLRITQLRLIEEKLSQEGFDDSRLRSILQLLFRTHALYIDRNSRRAVHRCLAISLSRGSDNVAIASFVSALVDEAAKPGIAASSAFVLVEWFSIAIQSFSSTPLWDKYSTQLLKSYALVLDKCLRPDSKHGAQHSAIIVTRRAFRKLLNQKDETRRKEALRHAVQTLAAKGPQPTARYAPLLGIIAGVSARIPDAKSNLSELKDQYFSFYSREVIGSRSPVPRYIAASFNDLFSDIVSPSDFTKEIVPSLEKGLLRAPEIVLSDIVEPLIQSLPKNYDLSDALLNNLLKPILANVKSTNPSIRSGALAAFRAINAKSENQDILDKVSDEILAPLKSGKLASPDQRLIHAEMLDSVLQSISISSAEKVAAAIVTVAGKEGNEPALTAETSALSGATVVLLKSGADVPKPIVDGYVKGLSDKKPSLRRIWLLRVGQVIYPLSKEDHAFAGLAKFAEAVVPKILDTYNEVVANPLVSAQNGLIVGGYVIVSIAQFLQSRVESASVKSSLAKTIVMGKLLESSPKPSFLLHSRVYTKLSTADDFEWLGRALFGLTNAPLASADASSRALWSEAVIYLTVSNHVDFRVSNIARQELSRFYAQSPKLISSLIANGLWDWLYKVESGDKESAAVLGKSEHDPLLPTLRAICLTPTDFGRLSQSLDKDQLEEQMCSLVTLARSELIPHANWIELCLKMELDPGELARKYEEELVENIRSRALDSNITSGRLAACNAAADLAFVAPTIMTKRLVELIEGDLDPSQFDSIGPLEAAIFKTPEGTAYVDVLSKKNNTVANKNTKDYDVLKWEEELKAQLAQKKGQERKLSADDAAKVNAQLKKEAEIRRSVASVAKRVTRSVGIIKSLATGPPTDATLWLRPATSLLLKAITSGACLITGDEAPLAYIACSNRVSSRLGPSRSFVGVATLRANNVTSIPDSLKQEPLADLITRILYKLRFTSEQRPFDVESLIYILPLLLHVLRIGGVGEDAEDRDTQLVLALEIMSFHVDVCADEALPRDDIFATLISSMQRYTQHYKSIKDCFADMCRCIAPNITIGEISVLVKGTIVPETAVRTAVLQGISAEVDMSEISFSEEIWLSCHDDVEENRDLGHDIWEESGFKLNPEVPRTLLPYLESKDSQLRRAASRALAETLRQDKSSLDDILERLEAAYTHLAKPRKPQLDEFGMPKKLDLSDPWEGRHGIGSALKELAPLLSQSQLDELFVFLIQNGPLGDQNGGVRSEVLDAAIRAIEVHGKLMVDKLMKVFEKTLEGPDKNSESSDRVNEAVIVMYGALARHLKPGDAKLPVVIERLIATLSTPSETVQYAIAECLPPLIRACGVSKSAKYFEEIMTTLLSTKKYASQRGAAYGLAGLVAGSGIGSLKDHRILSTLKGAMENKKEAHQREAALLVYELMSLILGRIFEPYVIQIVPQLLTGFGDSSADVREACLAAAKSCFAQLSSYGVKQILPTLLEGLDEQHWRSKKGACDLLGAMAYLDPQQLSQSLPEIIPPLAAVLNDSHKEVRMAANKSLKRFGEVISNPEVKSLVDILLKALSDPTKYTDEALDSLIKVHFVHYLDPPSLALVTRILQRGLADRSSTKRKAAEVIGSLAHLTERKDLISHLPVLVAGLKLAIVDPVPTTRATASRALGSLVEKLGEDALPDLIPGLMQTLKSDTGAGDRLGSAQALSEVLAGLGTQRLEETLPTILHNVESSRSSVREGFMSLFIFLPVCFGNSFANYLGRIIPPILAGLADDVESIRETALRAGRLLVKNFAMRAVDLLLPELERGLADDSYRIRLSSVELVGDLLFNLTGITANEDDEDDFESAKEANASLREILGDEKRNKILSALYVCRCDTSVAVRAAAVSVWKALVPNPRTLKELVPTLTQLLIRRLGSSNMEHKVIASNALGELIRKAGDGVLATLLPTLEAGLQSSTDTDARQGICLALKELIASATEEALESHEKTLISVVRTALTDSDEEVREAAAEAFDSLQQIIGKRAVDQVLPYLLSLLRSDENAANALKALLTLLTETTRSNIILPNLIPTLITPPISAFNAKALASLSRVAGPAMNRRLPNIVNSLMDNIINCTDDDLRADLDESFDTVILSIDEYDGLNTVMNVLLQLAKHEDHHRRATTSRHLAKFFSVADVDYSRYNQDIIRTLLNSFDDRDPEVVKASWAALSEFTKKLRKEDMESLVSSTRQSLQRVGVPGANLPGFELPKGISAILPIFLQGLMYGSPEQRTQSALAISDIIDRTSESALKPFVTQITGPLIRVVSERSTDVKEAILLTLNNLLEKMPTAIKPFLPQLQRTFAKSLADPSSEALRSRAAKALGSLIKYTPRIDPLIAELVTGSKTTDPGVRTAMLKALYEVVSKAGNNMGEVSRSAVLSLIDTESDERDTAMTISNARLLGALIKNVPEEAAHSLIKNRLMPSQPSNSSILGLNAVLVESRQVLLDSPLAEELPELLSQGMTNKNNFIADNAIIAAGKFLLCDSERAFDATKPIFETLADIIQPGKPIDSRRLALVIVRTLSRVQMNLVRPHIPILAPPIFASVRDPVIPVKLAAEAAFLALFNVMDDESKIFDKFMAGSGAQLPPNTKRSMQDYFKRVTLRLGSQARERREAEGGQGGLGLSNDEVEDEKEIWSVGKVEVGDVFS